MNARPTTRPTPTINHRPRVDLLEQVADNRAERDEVRRILSAQVTDAEITRLNAERAAEVEARVQLNAEQHARWRAAPHAVGPATHAHRYSACASGPCKGGTRPCPSPEACQTSAEPAPRPPRRTGDRLRIALLVLASWVAVAATLYAVGVRP